MTETVIITLFTVLTTLGSGVIAYLQRENMSLKNNVDKLRGELNELSSVLFSLVIAIKEDRTIPPTSTLGAKADEIIKKLSEKK